jgi:two-component system nitrate/nitrite response regulator NarL
MKKPRVNTSRQQQVLEKVKLGLTNKEISAALNISQFTVRDHVAKLLMRAGVRTRHQL